MIELDTVAIGDRLRALRGGLTQAAFAERLGLERQSVVRYEAGKRAPDALALLRLMTEFGADPAWVLTGAGAAPLLSGDERELLGRWRAAPLAVKAAAIGALASGAAQSGAKKRQVFHGAVGQVADGDIVNQGGVNVGGTNNAGIPRKRRAGGSG